MTARSRLGLVVVVVALLVVACDGDDGPSPASPSSAFPTATAAPPAGSPSGQPPSQPPDVEGTLTDGSVSLQIAGDAELETTLPTLITGIVAPPPAGFALVWSGEAMDATTIGIGGASFLGTRPTSPSLTLTIAAETDAGFSTWISSAGECEITIDTAQGDRVAGSFRCEDLRSSEGRSIAVSGRFEATG